LLSAYISNYKEQSHSWKYNGSVASREMLGCLKRWKIPVCEV
jgi:hypothetical protein